MSEMFDPNAVFGPGGGGKFLNAKFLKDLPKMACKVRILSGGMREEDDRFNPGKKRKVAFMNVESTTGLFEGTKEVEVNRTNSDILKAGLGPSTSWIGREIGIWFDPTVKVGTEVKGGMRFRVLEADPFAAPGNSTPAPAPAPAPKVEEEIPF